MGNVTHDEVLGVHGQHAETGDVEANVHEQHAQAGVDEAKLPVTGMPRRVTRQPGKYADLVRNAYAVIFSSI